MQDPWKYIAFPVSAIVAYFAASSMTSSFSAFVGLGEFNSRVILLAATGLLSGFLVDEVIPTYIQNIRNGSGGDIGGGMDTDMDAGGDFDFE